MSGPVCGKEAELVHRRILVIMHGALGDFVLALGPFQAIRQFHADAHITLLTTAPFADLAGQSPYFDEVWVDVRPPVWRLDQWLPLRRRLISGGFDRVYDLQTSDRTGWYFRFFPKAARPEWSGIAEGCSHPHANPQRNRLHAMACQAEQLAVAGIPEVPAPDLSWLDADVSAFGLAGDYVLLVPGGSAHRPAKRWPADHYAELARYISGLGLTPVLIGNAAEAADLERIAAACAQAVNLGGRTDFGQIAALARRARGAVGNDTGPMHLIAAVGCQSLSLFSAASDPARSAPRGPSTAVLSCDPLASLDVDEVMRGLKDLGVLPSAS
jgi:ADP-heptose:LPS heptosyltransferase